MTRTLPAALYGLLLCIAPATAQQVQPAPSKPVNAATAKYGSDPAMANDPGMKEYLAFAKQYLPDIDPTDVNAVYGFALGGSGLRP